jgi:hypothetical protein
LAQIFLSQGRVNRNEIPLELEDLFAVLTDDSLRILVVVVGSQQLKRIFLDLVWSCFDVSGESAHFHLEVVLHEVKGCVS